MIDISNLIEARRRRLTHDWIIMILIMMILAPAALLLAGGQPTWLVAAAPLAVLFAGWLAFLSESRAHWRRHLAGMILRDAYGLIPVYASMPEPADGEHTVSWTTVDDSTIRQGWLVVDGDHAGLYDAERRPLPPCDAYRDM